LEDRIASVFSVEEPVKKKDAWRIVITQKWRRNAPSKRRHFLKLHSIAAEMTVLLAIYLFQMQLYLIFVPCNTQ
jgi:hypothetical protein